MSINARLDRVTQNLSPLQRAHLVLQAVREGREPDPGLARIDDPQQRRAFNRYMALLWVANHQLGAVADIIAFRVQVAENEKARFLLLNEAADQLDEAEARPPSKGLRNWRNQDGPIEVSVFLRSLALECRDEAAAVTTLLWKELLSLERLWRDLAEEFAGEEVIFPEHRDRIEEARSDLRTIARAIGVRKLPGETDEAAVRHWTALVNHSFKQLGLVEPYL